MRTPFLHRVMFGISLALVLSCLVGCISRSTLLVELDPRGLWIDGRKAGPLVINPIDGYVDFPDSLYRHGSGNPRVEPLWRFVSGKHAPSPVELRCDTSLPFVLLKPLLRSLAQAGIATVRVCDRQGQGVQARLLDPSEDKLLFNDSLIQVQMFGDTLLVSAGVAPTSQVPGLSESFSLQPEPLVEWLPAPGEAIRVSWMWADSVVAALRRDRRQARLLVIESHPKVRIGQLLGLAGHLAKGERALPLALLGNLPR